MQECILDNAYGGCIYDCEDDDEEDRQHNINSASKRPRLEDSSAVSNCCPAPLATAKTSPKLKFIATKTTIEQPIPDPFHLPTNYRADVQLALSKGTMSREAKKSLLSSVAAHMSPVKNIPE